MGLLTALSSRLSLSRLPIAYKLALVFALLTASGMGLLGAIIAHDQSGLLDEQSREFGRTVARQMADASRDQLMANDKLAMEITIKNLIANERILGAAIYSEDMAPLVHVGIVPPQHLLKKGNGEARMLEWNLGTTQGSPVPFASFIACAEFDGVMIGYALVTFDHSFMTQARQQTIQKVFGFTVVLILVGVLISIALGRRVSQPIHQLVDASRSISQGDYHFNIDQNRKDEVGHLMQSLSSMCEGLKQKVILEESFSRYVSPKVAKAVVGNPGFDRLGGHHVHASVLFADIVGFTSLSENMHPANVSELLNEYFGYIAKAAHVCHGHVDKFIGDCAMLVFGAPEADRLHSFHALVCAILIQKLIKSLNDERLAKGLDAVQFRIGVNSGMMLAGNMGAPERMNYTVIGDSVNLASRLSTLAGPDQIVISEAMYEALKSSGYPFKVRSHGLMNIRGKREPVSTYLVLDIDSALHMHVDRIMGRIMELKAA